ncbi:hypothetical protein N7481_006858 [Penicillium waksmanii]|uniref:uncharacterized protein n=1 Tax=Penicillium waksmanii TaxID=69791 RepID=UPI0025488E17|nr:uncharacterized protein N7481_006858 [Penicillium waksmanii]KAJ5979560.1 hypothetical protein N7481_006858 [Penicillium waksmanii]
MDVGRPQIPIVKIKDGYSKVDPSLYEYPTLKSLARDIFSIPTTGAGVKRLFNSACDICHYHRGSLCVTTIQELILYKFTTKRNISHIKRLKRFRKDTGLLKDTLDPISNDEEDETIGSQDQDFTQTATERVGEKRRLI